MNTAIKRQAFRELLERLLSNMPAEAIPKEKTWEDGMLVSKDEAKTIVQLLISKHAKSSGTNEKAIPDEAPEFDSPSPLLPEKRPRPEIPDGMRPPLLPGGNGCLSPSASLVKEFLCNSFFSKEEAERLALQCSSFESLKREEGQKEYFISIDHLDHHQRYAAMLAISRAYPRETVRLSSFGPEEAEHAIIHFGGKSAERRRPAL
ncbi:MAG: hypothetical protein QXH30_03205 [Candidatus Bilamarchaeaceae archaeon]